jgi:RHS repeat-associated protein
LASAGCKQGVDFSYSITGALKGINSDDPAVDPGSDTSPADFFGETLHYFDNDYDPASGSPINISIGESGFNNLYGGAVKAISYHNSTETTSSGTNARKVYAYQYDALKQMKVAKFGSMSGPTATLAEAFRENVDLYDKNGNIKTLLRNGKTNTVNPAYNYNYITNTNKVSTITQGAITAVTYTYNDIGQVIRKDEGGTKVMNMTYNALGLIKEVRNGSNQLMQTYDYDDRGDLIKKTTYNAGALVKTTYYINDVAGNALAIYEQPNAGALALKELPIYGMSRLATYKPAVSTYFYEVSDHLGNVRGVCGLPAFTSYFTNFETATNSDFLNYTSQTFDLLDHTDAGGTVYQKVQMLNGGANGRVGVAKTLAVSPGDQVSISAYVKYMNLSTTPNPTVFATALTSAFGVSSSSTGEQLAAYNSLNQYAGTVPGGDHPLDVETAPKVFVTILLFDKNNALIDATWDQVTTVGEQTSPTTKQPPHDLLSASYTVRQPGYAYIFVSNEHPTYLDAAFDDVTITHSQSPIVAGADYYPFGLVMEGREITDEPYRYGYQGPFSEKDALTELNEFEVRLYEPKYGRWLQPDPLGQYASPYVGMGNLPHISVDPTGEWSWVAAGIGFAVGATVGYIASDGDWAWAAFGGVVGGTLGGVAFNQDYSGATKFNGGYREYGGLRITWNTSFLKNNWVTMARLPLAHVGQGEDAGVPNTQNCVYACEESVEQYIGGGRNRRDFNRNQNGTVMDQGTPNVFAWQNRWRSDFRRNFRGQGTSLPNARIISRNMMRRGNVYSLAIREKNYPPNYEHNVLIKEVQRNTRTGKYRYKLMDPNKDRPLSGKELRSAYRRHIIVGP